ncbi:MAG: hypothetical protein AAGI08_03770 [Bacteroidota bacterium]
MVKLVLKSVLYLASVAGACALLFWVIVPNNSNAYQAAQVDKIQLAAETESPKIMLVGGSNLAFSMNSEWLSEQAEQPVVNMGVSKAVGMRYMLEEAKPHVNAGDLIVLSPEYEVYYDIYYGSESLTVMLMHYPHLLTKLSSWGEWETFLSTFLTIMRMKVNGYIRTGVASLEDTVYRRDGFNAHGDLTTHIDLETDLDERSLFGDESVPFQEDAIRAMNAFAAHAEARGATVVLSFPSLYDAYLERYASRIDAMERRLRSELTFPVISDPADYAFPRTALYDTPYHLLREGRQQRTEQLWADLQARNAM